MNRPYNSEIFNTLKDFFISLPHCAALGMQFENMVGCKPTLSIEWQPEFVGHADSGILHGGVITPLIDIAGATAVAAHLDMPEALATLDLRIDYLCATPSKGKILATSECYRLGAQVAFVRTVCYTDENYEPFALGTATYMRVMDPFALETSTYMNIMEKLKEQQQGK
ncbi:MAG: hotdog fold thioesterase [Neisseriaceae bacterium]|nr:hotdog fold thioesterase [Neisseriaceae bacterium]